MAEEITPTLTLAKLYEAQYELVDAVNIYSKLNEKMQLDELKTKIDDLTKIIFENINRNYKKEITRIFSAEELRYFRIIPGDSVYISRNEANNNVNSLDIARDQDDIVKEIDQLDSFGDEKIIDDESALSQSELEAIEERLLSGNNFILEDGLTDNLEYLQNERERLIKKLESIEQKLNRIALEKDNSPRTESAGSTDTEVSKNDH